MRWRAASSCRYGNSVVKEQPLPATAGVFHASKDRRSCEERPPQRDANPSSSRRIAIASVDTLKTLFKGISGFPLKYTHSDNIRVKSRTDRTRERRLCSSVPLNANATSLVSWTLSQRKFHSKRRRTCFSGIKKHEA